MDRRNSTRRIQQLKALIGRRRSRIRQCENAVIEEESGNGLRIRSGAPLQQDDSVILYNVDGTLNCRAKVVWSREEGLIDKRAGGRVGKAHIAGCRIKFVAEKAPRRKIEFSRLLAQVVRYGVIGIGVVLAGLVAYLLTSILSLW